MAKSMWIVTILVIGLLGLSEGRTVRKRGTTCTKSDQRESTGYTISYSRRYYTISTTCYPPLAIRELDAPYKTTATNGTVKTFTIPKNPAFADSVTHIGLGIVAITVGGLCIYDECTSSGTNALLLESFDDCNCHPSPTGVYHCHARPSLDNCPCNLYNTNKHDASLPKKLGLALDGFDLVSDFYPNGTQVSSDWLDECHGVQFTGDYYAYVAQDQDGKHPYTVGCFKGTPVDYRAADGPMDCTAGN